MIYCSELIAMDQQQVTWLSPHVRPGALIMGVLDVSYGCALCYWLALLDKFRLTVSIRQEEGQRSLSASSWDWQPCQSRSRAVTVVSPFYSVDLPILVLFDESPVPRRDRSQGLESSP